MTRNLTWAWGGFELKRLCKHHRSQSALEPSQKFQTFGLQPLWGRWHKAEPNTYTAGRGRGVTPCLSTLKGRPGQGPTLRWSVVCKAEGRVGCLQGRRPSRLFARPKAEPSPRKVGPARGQPLDGRLFARPNTPTPRGSRIPGTKSVAMRGAARSLCRRESNRARQSRGARLVISRR